MSDLHQRGSAYEVAGQLMQSARVLGVSRGSSEWAECEHVGEGVNRDPDASWGPQVPELKAHKAVPELCTRALNELSLCAKPSRPQGRAYGWGHHLMYLLQRSCMSFRVCCVLGRGVKG